MASTGGVPSTGSPELFSRALRELSVEKKARDAGVKDQPPSNSPGPDSNERQFVTWFTDELRERRKQCDADLSRLANDRTATSAKVDLDQTRAALAHAFNAIEPDLTRIKQDHQPDLEKAKDREARSLRYLRHFQLEHGQDREADPHPSAIWHFALVAVFALAEWVALSIFYAEGSDFGLLGGILMAMALSLVNIGLAVFAGAIIRYVNHKSGLRKALALLGFTILTLLFFFATGFAAHYRNAARDVAAASQDQQQQSSGRADSAGQAAISRASGGDDDQWKASKLAWEQFRERGFVFADVLSWILVILAILFGIIAVWKGYGIDDRYPGYGPISRRYEENRAAYDAEKKKYTGAVDNVFRKVGSEQEQLLRNVRKEIEYFQKLAKDSEDSVAAYVAYAAQVADTCHAVVHRYREINRQVATSSPPAYFDEPVKLDPVLLQTPSALTAGDRALLGQYTAAIREFTALVATDDARRQALRQTRLGELAGFFERIERAINEKLARENSRDQG
jgi:hypothetical protein